MSGKSSRDSSSFSDPLPDLGEGRVRVYFGNATLTPTLSLIRERE
jgi:hypothetical protein